tara:strand:+ start:251 stop:421 length:171 start_codon:yes stop_codon:yes gene_type:complete
MKKLFILLFLTSCVSSNSLEKPKTLDIFFDENLSYEEFYSLLKKYAENNQYPNIDN